MKERTIYQWAQEGKLPAFKLGATWRFRREEIDAWLETQHSGPKVSPVRLPLVPPARLQPTRWETHQQEQERRQKEIDECRNHIETTLRIEDQTVFLVERFLDRFSEEVVHEVVRQLKREKKVSESEVRGRDGAIVKVITRRK